MNSSTDLSRPTRRILLECTTTYLTGLNTGIERVVRNVVRESAAIGREYGVECLPVVRVRDRFLTLPWAFYLNGTQRSWRPSLARHRPLPGTRSSHAWSDLARRWGTRWRKIFYPRTLARELTYLRWSWQGEAVLPHAGDTLVLLDTWWSGNIWPAVAQARHHGAVIGVVAYDLLPVTHPEFFKADLSEAFTASLNIALEQGDYFLAISDVVRDALRDYAAAQGPPRRARRPSFASFRLGSTLHVTRGTPRVRDLVRQVFDQAAGQRPYLTVGTIEPRKNHTLVLDAFERVWARFPHARVCLVGRIGWLCDDLVRRIVRHAQYGRSLFMFNDLTDAELAYCYTQAKALVFPSHAEGFGLPIAEALQLRLPALVSDIPVHREVGGDFCTYFDPHSAESLARLLCDIEAAGRLPRPRRPDGDALPDWTASTREFVGKCLAACGDTARPASAPHKAA